MNRLIGFTQSNILSNREVSFSRLHQWITDCESHGDCSKCRERAVQTDDSRPSRLLDLSDESKVKLVDTISGVSYHYACLSHRWDDTLPNTQTTTDNISSYRNFIDIESLPTNFRDAIIISRELKIYYLWIDSLCIIQEGDEGRDLSNELAKMGYIYQNAYITIATFSSPNSAGGCFMKDAWPDLCLSIIPSDNNEPSFVIAARILDKKGPPKTPQEIYNQYPLLTRGWVFQERMLSPRLLQCNYGEFAFECLETSRCECKSNFAPHEKNSTSGLKVSSFANRVRLRGDFVPGELEAAMNCWSDMVESYSLLKLTMSKDVLPAIAGCAQLLSLRSGYRYIAGMWEETLAIDLLWHLVPSGKRKWPEQRQTAHEWTAPSWSWASVKPGQRVRMCKEWAQASSIILRTAIKEVYCPPELDTNPFGKLKSQSSWLKLESTLYPWYLRRSCLFTWIQGARTPKSRALFDLHLNRRGMPSKCSTEIPNLDIDYYRLSFLPDFSLIDDIDFEPIGHCRDQQAPLCGLARIYLLHALHKENQKLKMDIFLVLCRLEPADGMPNCYRRIGLLLFDVEQSKPGWNEVLEPIREQFYIF
jgi:hypothetical protein